MPDVPAICRTCGTVFPSGIFAENSRGLTITGCTAGRCPNCGGTGEVPDGVYDFAGRAMRVVAHSAYSRVQLERIAALVVQAREAGTPAGDVAAGLEDEAPELADLARRVLAPRSPADLAGFLMVLLMVVQLYLMSKPPSQPTEAQLNRLAEQAVERAIEQPAHRASRRPRVIPRQAAAAAAPQARARSEGAQAALSRSRSLASG